MYRCHLLSLSALFPFLLDLWDFYLLYMSLYTNWIRLCSWVPIPFLSLGFPPRTPYWSYYSFYPPHSIFFLFFFFFGTRCHCWSSRLGASLCVSDQPGIGVSSFLQNSSNSSGNLYLAERPSFSPIGHAEKPKKYCMFHDLICSSKGLSCLLLIKVSKAIF